MNSYATVIVLSAGLTPCRFQNYAVPFETRGEFYQRLEIILIDHAKSFGPVRTFQVFFEKNESEKGR